MNAATKSITLRFKEESKRDCELYSHIKMGAIENGMSLASYVKQSLEMILSDKSLITNGASCNPGCAEDFKHIFAKLYSICEQLSLFEDCDISGEHDCKNTHLGSGDSEHSGWGSLPSENTDAPDELFDLVAQFEIME